MNNKCQVFTPPDYVEKLLDSIEYKRNLYGKRIIENSCGDGNILTAIVKRYIADCKLNGFSSTKIKNGLSRDIYGAEIDPKQFKRCIQKLNIILQENGISQVNWNVTCEDYLRKEDTVKYDFVVGNPPYITYSELSKDSQSYLRENYRSCEKGKFDYYYAFVEKSVDSLSSDGKMAYLIPSAVFKTVHGENTRNIICPVLKKIYDYTLEKVFDSALVKSSIIVIDKACREETFIYKDESTGEEREIKKSGLGRKWIFIDLHNDNYTRRFGDYFKVSHVVATLLNEAFVIKNPVYDTVGNCIINGITVERELIRETATPRAFCYGSKEAIIFPYGFDEHDKLVRYSENEFKKKFPGGYEYLAGYKEKLLKRDSDGGAQWFEYGRSQALTNLNKEKYLLSTVFSHKIQAYHLSKECIPYAGMFIVPLDTNSQITLENGMKLFETERFEKYIMAIGIHINGNSLRVTSKDIENFMF